MKEFIIATIIAIIFVLLVFYIKKTMIKIIHRSGVSDIVKIIKQNEQVIQTTPKTLSVKESLFLDDIKKDFPELNISQTKSFVTEIVSDYFDFLETGNMKELEKDCTENFISQAKQAERKNIQNLKFHKTFISNYKKDNDTANITFQTSCQYEENNQIIQTRFEIEYIYFLENTPDTKTISLKCPNCGAPIEYTGEKICIFCGCKLISPIKYVWKFNKIKEF